MCPLPQCSVCSAYYELPQSFNLLQIKIARIFLTGAERDTASSSQCSKLNLNSKYILKIWTIALQLKLSSVGESEKRFGQVTHTGGRILFFVTRTDHFTTQRITTGLHFPIGDHFHFLTKYQTWIFSQVKICSK